MESGFRELWDADREYFGQKLGLERIQRLLGRLRDPHKKFPSVHIAGTNGKGSTAAMVAQILAEAGYKVGLYTSPHLVDFCERIQTFSPLPLAGEGRGVREIAPDQVLHYARAVREIEDPSDRLTFFEMATAIAFLHFAEEKIDIAVVEVGMGGRLDATNVIAPLVSVITTIGLDHTQYLGDTIEKIAFEKAGIIKKGVPVVVGLLVPEAMEVVEKVTKEWDATLIPSPPWGNSPACRGRWPAEGRLEGADEGEDEGELKVALAGAHQLQNAAVAICVIDELRRQRWAIPEETVVKGFAKVHLPGRLETVREKPWIILDGGHNPDAIGAVCKFLEPRLEGRRLKVLFGAMADKDLRGMIAALAPITEEFLFTAVDSKRAADPADLDSLARSFSVRSCVVRGVQEAWVSMIEGLGEEEVALVTGSFYLVGEVRQWLYEPD